MGQLLRTVAAGTDNDFVYYGGGATNVGDACYGIDTKKASNYDGPISDRILSCTLENGSGEGAVTNVNLGAVISVTSGTAYMYLGIRTHDTWYYSTLYTVYGSANPQSIANDWAVNPNTSAAWTWDEIDALEVGLKTTNSLSSTEVDYLPVNVDWHYETTTSTTSTTSTTMTSTSSSSTTETWSESTTLTSTSTSSTSLSTTTLTTTTLTTTSLTSTSTSTSTSSSSSTTLTSTSSSTSTTLTSTSTTLTTTSLTSTSSSTSSSTTESTSTSSSTTTTTTSSTTSTTTLSTTTLTTTGDDESRPSQDWDW